MAMTISYEQAVAEVTGPGQVFEVVPARIQGVDQLVFAHAPASLRELFGTARSYGDRPFLVFEDERFDFAEVMASVDALAALLVRRYGIGRGDRVAIAMRNLPEWIVSFAAITSVGAVSVSLNAWWGAEELEFGVADSQAAVVIADPPRARLAAPACARRGVRLLVARSAGEDPPAGADRWEDVLPAGAAMPEAAVAADDDATILYTSGTTGRPKGAVSTHRAVIQALMGFACKAAVDSRLEQARGGPDQPAEKVFILALPLFHVTGCVPVMLSCFALGMRLVMMGRWDPDRALELVEREGVTSFVGVPTQAWDLLACAGPGRHDTSSLRSLSGGGAPAPPVLVERLAAGFGPGSPGIGYGLTETNAYGPGNSGADYRERPGSVGRVTPIVQVAVRDAAGADVPRGCSGEIWLKGPNLFRGYWRQPEATAAALADGWLRTGDLGHLDGDGFLYVEDRIKDVVLRAGENVSPAEVEAVLYEHPAVRDVAVVGVPHPRLGEEVAAAVVPEPDQVVDPGSLGAYVAGRLAPFKAPTYVALLPEGLPRNAAGKVLKRELRATLAARRGCSGFGGGPPAQAG